MQLVEQKKELVLNFYEKTMKILLFRIICGTLNLVLPTLINKMHPAFQTVNFFI